MAKSGGIPWFGAWLSLVERLLWMSEDGSFSGYAQQATEWRDLRYPRYNRVTTPIPKPAVGQGKVMGTEGCRRAGAPQL